MQYDPVSGGRTHLACRPAETGLTRYFMISNLCFAGVFFFEGGKL
ncbi:hypothetical protein W822_20435 [Advenella kashmirensis W13003]|uniref:Uncharacterized protein n=1 Tax=Advenella kashmirensis W13003 TaxID=1424334 RepID=V8QPN4_9BURK|nr:hypothetical protein W822_20435 [Advenella kashmirensis W13003]